MGLISDKTDRVNTPSLNEMRAKQGAIVAKFMTFYKRTRARRTIGAQDNKF